jgi:uncharacterized protein (UPF0276 family)
MSEMKLSVNHSMAMIALVHAGEVQVDAVEVVDKLSLAEIETAREALPGINFHFHQGRMHFTRKGVARLAKYLALCPQSPFISIHLAPLSFFITAPALQWQLYLPEPDEEKCIQRFIKQVKELKIQFKTPVILENMPALHPQKYRFESEPEVIRRVLEETGCQLLLDLAHARIAAEVRGMSGEEYLSALPLEHTVQLHLSGTRSKDGRLYDAHESLEEVDYTLLSWVLERVHPEWLTLEYFRENPDQVRQQLTRLRGYLPATV